MKTVNEERLFRQLPYFFDRPSGVFTELAQNAHRAGATSMAIRLEDDVLTVLDDGPGTDNVEALFCLASSDWSEDVEANQMPAGWGLYFLMSISDSIRYLSRFGSITVDCNAYLESRNYRKNILSLVDPSGRLRGMLIEARLKKDVAGQLDLYRCQNELGWFPIDITVNGKPIERNLPDVKYGGYAIKTTYQGNRVWIDPYSIHGNPEAILNDTVVIWYGIPIGAAKYGNWLAIEVKDGAPLTPVLPYRASVQADAKASAFAEFVRKELARFCTKTINDYAGESIREGIVSIMKLAGKVLKQEELDKLNAFFVAVREPYYSNELDQTADYKIVRKGNADFVSEKVRVFVDGEEEAYDYRLVLPEGTVTEIETYGACPSWLHIEEKEKVITVTPADEPKDMYFMWQNAEISCDGEDLPVLALVEGVYDGRVYYRESPNDFNEIEYAVFVDRVCYTDGEDCYETQKDEYQRAIEMDIANITGVYSLDTLLDGVRKLGIRVRSVKEIHVEGDNMRIVTDEGEKTVRIAA